MTVVNCMLVAVVAVFASAAIGAEDVELRLYPIVGGWCRADAGLGIKFAPLYSISLKGRRECTSADPVALLQIRNLSDERISIPDPECGSWFAQIAVSNKTYIKGLMTSGSNRFPFLKEVGPDESLCYLLCGDLTANGCQIRACFLRGMKANGVGVSIHTGSSFTDACDVVYSNYIFLDASVFGSSDRSIGDGFPKLAVFRLENSWLKGEDDSSACFDSCSRNEMSVEFVLLVENGGGLPIKCESFDSGYWKVEFVNKDGSVAVHDGLRRIINADASSAFALTGGCGIAVWLSVPVEIEEYKRLEKIRVEYDSGSRHAEAELAVGKLRQSNRFLDKRVRP